MEYYLICVTKGDHFSFLVSHNRQLGCNEGAKADIVKVRFRASEENQLEEGSVMTRTRINTVYGT